jgi:hypothetical protein
MTREIVTRWEEDFMLDTCIHVQLTQYKDLWERANKRSRVPFDGEPQDYLVVVRICPQDRITLAEIYYIDECDHGVFIGAGIAVRNPIDAINSQAGIRLAISRALDSIGLYLHEEE